MLTQLREQTNWWHPKNIDRWVWSSPWNAFNKRPKHKQSAHAELNQLIKLIANQNICVSHEDNDQMKLFTISTWVKSHLIKSTEIHWPHEVLVTSSGNFSHRMHMLLHLLSYCVLHRFECDHYILYQCCIWLGLLFQFHLIPLDQMSCSHFSQAQIINDNLYSTNTQTHTPSHANGIWLNVQNGVPAKERIQSLLRLIYTPTAKRINIVWTKYELQHFTQKNNNGETSPPLSSSITSFPHGTMIQTKCNTSAANASC